MDNHTPEQRRKNMQAIKSKDSSIELMLRRELWARGLRYRKNDKSVFGHPDLTFKRKKIAVFVDGEFWHGHNWKVRKSELKSNQEYWIPKIERNMQRDKEVTEKLKAEGWRVTRLWGKEVKADVSACADRVETAIRGQK